MGQITSTWMSKLQGRSGEFEGSARSQNPLMFLWLGMICTCVAVQNNIFLGCMGRTGTEKNQINKAKHNRQAPTGVNGSFHAWAKPECFIFLIVFTWESNERRQHNVEKWYKHATALKFQMWIWVVWELINPYFKSLTHYNPKYKHAWGISVHMAFALLQSLAHISFPTSVVESFSCVWSDPMQC